MRLKLTALCFKWLQTGLLFFYSTAVFAQTDSSFSLVGKINDPSVSKLFISYYSNVLEKGVTDSSLIKDGEFSFAGRMSYPAFVFIKLTSSRVWSDSMWYAFIEPGHMELILQTHPFRVEKMTGSPSFSSYDSLERERKKIMLRYKNTLDLYQAGNLTVKDSLALEIKQYSEDSKKLDFSFFFANPNSVVTSHLLQAYYRKVSIDTLEQLYGMMNSNVRGSIYGDRLNSFITKENNLNVGKPAPLFSTVTLDGKCISLAEFKENYVLLDFWAHWCVPCRRSFPELIGLYNKYNKQGLRVIGIASDDFDVDKWKEAIQQDKISIWYNILDGKKKDADGKINMDEL